MGQSKTKLNIIVCGLDNSGKSTIINQLKPKKQRSENIAATVGYNMESFMLGKVKFTAFDMGGAKKFRALWESYYSSVEGVVFVIDSSDTLRMCIVKDEIQQIVEHPDMKDKNIPVLFFANKMDICGAKSLYELTQMLDLDKLMVNNSFQIFASNALTGVGLSEGMEWLQKAMMSQASTSH